MKYIKESKVKKNNIQPRKYIDRKKTKHEMRTVDKRVESFQY
jgi:hypothetical protein